MTHITACPPNAGGWGDWKGGGEEGVCRGQGQGSSHTLLGLPPLQAILCLAFPFFLFCKPSPPSAGDPLLGLLRPRLQDVERHRAAAGRDGGSRPSERWRDRDGAERCRPGGAAAAPHPCRQAGPHGVPRGTRHPVTQ